LVPGSQVGNRYRIEQLLGVGGMAHVWRATDLERHIQVAFKEMLVPAIGTVAELEESSLLFRREYFAMRKLQHPGTVKVYDCGVMANGNRYLTMEVVSGRDLCDVAARAPLPCRDVQRILTELAQILGFVHSRLYVHCDVKAENVRLTDAGEIKLMDFGVMHPMGARASGKVWGTPTYMAPEWRERGNIDGRSDLYSLGVLGFFLLTRTTPFETAEIGSTANSHVMRPALELAALTDLDPTLLAIIVRLLERDPKDRFASATDLVAALCAANGGTTIEEPLAARASYLHLPVVIGRQRETKELSSRLQAAIARNARPLLIGAPAGVGKSRLVEEFELEAKNSDIPFALGQCRAEGLSARAPIEQALRVLVPATPVQILDPLRAVLGRLLPSLAGPAAKVFRNANEEKIAVFAALSRWLRDLAAQTPFVLCFEDLHWADSSTLETMNVIIRALQSTAGLVIATFRSDELSRLSLAFQTVDEGLADTVELAPLSPLELGTLVEMALQGFHPGDVLASRLFEATAGNVFFATECLRALIEQGALMRRLGTWVAAPELVHRSLPRSIKHVVLARLSTLSADQISFFQRLAPAGQVLDMPLIQAVADVEAQDLFHILDEGVERQFLQYVEGRYFFTHATVHEAIYESTPEAMRRRYHGRIAEHLLAVSGTEPEVARAIGYHFARSDEPTRAIDPLLVAGARALDNKALLEAFGLLEEAAGLLEDHPQVVDRDRRLIAAWGTLIEVGYNSSTPSCIRYAQKLFRHWDTTTELASGQAEIQLELTAARAANPVDRGALLASIFHEIAIDDARGPRAIFLKRAEYRILESIALAITGRTAEFAAGLERTAQEHSAESPYRAAAFVAVGGLTSHTGHFRGAVEEMRRHLDALRAFTSVVPTGPRRLQWSLGMGAYFMNMNLALMGRPLDDSASADGVDVAERTGFIDVCMYHLFSQIVRASFIGDAAMFQPRFAEMNELMRKLGNPRLPERNLAIYTPPFYLERGELELARAVIQRGERLVKLLPGDRWLKLYVDVYCACLQVAVAAEASSQQAGAAALGAIGRSTPEEIESAIESAIEHALATSSSADFRMETLVLIYQSRFERARGRIVAARAAAEAALARATEPLRANPFDEILARRALAEVSIAADSISELSQALTLANDTGNVLQRGIVSLMLAERTWHHDRSRATAHLEVARASFAAARADRWMRRVHDVQLH
jgi:eukaryotic-like serine/threonine-protein kinase